MEFLGTLTGAALMGDLASLECAEEWVGSREGEPVERTRELGKGMLGQWSRGPVLRWAPLGHV